MSETKTIAHKAIMVAALMLSVAALPFSVKVCHAAIIAVVVNWLFEGQWRSKLSVVTNSLLLQVIIALFFFQVAGLAFSDNLQHGLFIIEKKIFFLVLPIVLATTAIKLNETEIKRILAVFVAACFAGTVLCIIHAWNETSLVMSGQAQINPYLSTSSFSDFHRFKSEKWILFSYVSLADGISIHPTYFSLFVAFCLIFLLREFPQIKSRLFQAGLLALILYLAAFVIFLASRIVILGLSLIFLFVLIRGVINRNKSLVTLTIIVAFESAFILFVNPVSRYRGLQEINASTFIIQPGNNYQNAASIRFSLWWLAFRSLQDTNPLTGAGTGDVKKAMIQASNLYNITNVVNSVDPHNQYLYTLLANGYGGLFLLILCLGLSAYFSWLQRDYLLLGFLFLFLMLCFTESALELQKGVVFYSLFSALLFFQLNSFQSISINFRSLLRAGP